MSNPRLTRYAHLFWCRLAAPILLGHEDSDDDLLLAPSDRTRTAAARRAEERRRADALSERRRGRVGARDHAAANEDELASATLLPVRRGDVTVHDEFIAHGSGGNLSQRVRKTYVLAVTARWWSMSADWPHSYNDDADVIARIRAGEL